MQRRIVCTFSGDRYHDSTKLIVDNSQKFGASEAPWVYDDIWLKEKCPEHCEKTKWAFDHPKCRGVNWFCFKPWTVQHALNRCSKGDIILFVDGDTWPVSDMTPLFDMCDRDGFALFAACGHLQKTWSKRDTQIVMNMDTEYWRNKQAGVARFMLFKKGYTHYAIYANELIGVTVDTGAFVRWWLEYTCDQRANTFDKSVLAPEYEDEFKEARCEQAILTNLAHRCGIPLHREADQWGNGFEKDFPSDTYPQIFYSTGEYSYDANPLPGQKGSRFRNVND